MFEYICTGCGATLEDSANDFHLYNGCPYCHSDIERAVQCSKCTEMIPDSKAYYGLCPTHKREALKKILSVFADMEDGEVEYVQDFLDGRDWREWRTW